MICFSKRYRDVPACTVTVNGNICVKINTSICISIVVWPELLWYNRCVHNLLKSRRDALWAKYTSDANRVHFTEQEQREVERNRQKKYE